MGFANPEGALIRSTLTWSMQRVESCLRKRAALPAGLAAPSFAIAAPDPRRKPPLLDSGCSPPSIPGPSHVPGILLAFWLLS